MGWNDNQNLTALQNVTARHIPLAHILKTASLLKTKLGIHIRVTIEHIDTTFNVI